MGRDPQAIWKPSPNRWDNREGHTPRWIILHGTAGTAAGAISWFENPASQVSAHYLVCQDGTIVQFVDENGSAWANGAPEDGAASWWLNGVNPNYTTISIEHEKPDTSNATPLTAIQQMASFQLVSRICQRWNIPARQADSNGGITGHYSIDPINRAHCPGTYPWSDLFNFLHQVHGETTNMLALTDPMGKFFTDMGNGHWHCKPKNTELIGANLAFWRQHEGIGGLPLTNEIELQPYKDTRMVICERWIQAFDKGGIIPGERPSGSGDVYLLHIDSGIGQQIVAKALVQELQKQVTALQAQVKTESSTALETQLASYKQALQQVATIANKAIS